MFLKSRSLYVFLVYYFVCNYFISVYCSYIHLWVTQRRYHLHKIHLISLRSVLFMSLFQFTLMAPNSPRFVTIWCTDNKMIYVGIYKYVSIVLRYRNYTTEENNNNNSKPFIVNKLWVNCKKEACNHLLLIVTDKRFEK